MQEARGRVKPLKLSHSSALRRASRREVVHRLRRHPVSAPVAPQREARETPLAQQQLQQSVALRPVRRPVLRPIRRLGAPWSVLGAPVPMAEGCSVLVGAGAAHAVEHLPPRQARRGTTTLLRVAKEVRCVVATLKATRAARPRLRLQTRRGVREREG